MHIRTHLKLLQELSSVGDFLPSDPGKEETVSGSNFLEK